MTFSPIKSKLLNFELTPSKVVVSYDINGWMETNLKQNNRQTSKPRGPNRPLPARPPIKKIEVN